MDPDSVFGVISAADVAIFDAVSRVMLIFVFSFITFCSLHPWCYPVIPVFLHLLSYYDPLIHSLVSRPRTYMKPTNLKPTKPKKILCNLGPNIKLFLLMLPYLVLSFYVTSWDFFFI